MTADKALQFFTSQDLGPHRLDNGPIYVKGLNFSKLMVRLEHWQFLGATLFYLRNGVAKSSCQVLFLDLDDTINPQFLENWLF